MIQEWIDAEAFLKRGCPAKSAWFAEALLPEECERRIVDLTLGPRCKEAEVTDVVPIAVGNVIDEYGQEFGEGVSRFHRPLRACILRHKTDFLTINRAESVLRDRRPSSVTTRISEECFLLRNRLMSIFHQRSYCVVSKLSNAARSMSV